MNINAFSLSEFSISEILKICAIPVKIRPKTPLYLEFCTWTKNSDNVNQRLDIVRRTIDEQKEQKSYLKTKTKMSENPVLET
jgi:hypothetical protein